MDGYRRNSHVKFALKVHNILVSKYRKKFFNNKQMNDDVKQFIYESVQRQKFRIIQTEADKDHIHTLLEYSPKQSISNIVQNIKQYSTHGMWKYHNKMLSKLYWKKECAMVWWVFCLQYRTSIAKHFRKIYSKPRMIPPCILTPKGMGFYGENFYKISYKLSSEYNIFNKKIDENATKVTIYKVPTQ